MPTPTSARTPLPTTPAPNTCRTPPQPVAPRTASMRNPLPISALDEYRTVARCAQFVLVGNVVHRTRALATRDCVAAATPAGLSGHADAGVEAPDAECEQQIREHHDDNEADLDGLAGSKSPPVALPTIQIRRDN